jgi:hypothetical protein
MHRKPFSFMYIMAMEILKYCQMTNNIFALLNINISISDI